MAIMEGMAFAATVFGNKPAKPVYELVRAPRRLLPLPCGGHLRVRAGSISKLSTDGSGSRSVCMCRKQRKSAQGTVGGPRVDAAAQVPSACFVQPPLTFVGLTESAAVENLAGDLDVFVSKFRPMKYTISGREEKTVMKIIVHVETNKARPPAVPRRRAAHMHRHTAGALQRMFMQLLRVWPSLSLFKICKEFHAAAHRSAEHASSVGALPERWRAFARRSSVCLTHARARVARAGRGRARLRPGQSGDAAGRGHRTQGGRD